MTIIDQIRALAKTKNWTDSDVDSFAHLFVEEEGLDKKFLEFLRQQDAFGIPKIPNTLMVWLTSGPDNTSRHAKVYPVLVDGTPDPNQIRVVLEVWHKDKKSETKAEGVGPSTQDAFAAAYSELVQWLL